MKVAQKWKNQTSRPVENRLVVSQTSHPVASQLVTSQLVVNQLVTNQLAKSHQQENARTLPLCSATILFSLLIALPMTPVKCLVMSNAQMEHSSWVKTERLVLQLPANARDQNASGSVKTRRLSTVKLSPSGCANKLATIFYFCNKFNSSIK